MDRRQFVKALATGMAAAVVSSGCVTVRRIRRRRKPNIIYAFSDEHRWQSMSCTEMPQLHTPNMARLASEGVSFTHCISNCSVCSPHRAILMTSRWPYQQGVIDNKIPLGDDEHTLGKLFGAAGYDTAYIGKWHLGGTRAERFGFDHSLIWGNTGDHWEGSTYHPKDGDPVSPKGYNATLMTDQAISYIAGHRKRPFFLMLSWNPPHSKFTNAPPDKKALYPEGSLPWRPNYEAPAPEPDATNEPIWDRNDWENYQGYHAHISAIDEELGRIMWKLEELGLAEDTILVYSSDHGSMFGSHGVGSKRQPYDESIRVPFLIRWPGRVLSGFTPDTLFGTIDIMPTLCGLAGVPIADTCMGLDFSPTLTEGTGPNPDSQFIMHISKVRASYGEKHPAPIFRGVRAKRYTYAVFPDGGGYLFDNHADPYQMVNLFTDPGKKVLRKELDALLRRWLGEAEDPFEINPCQVALHGSC